MDQPSGSDSGVVNADEEFCISECTNPVDNKSSSCKLCAKKFHCECVGIKSKAASPVFTCPECKDAFRALKTVSKDINELKKVSKEVDSMKTMFAKQMKELKLTIESKDAANTTLALENAKLLTQIATLTAELNKAKWNNFRLSDKSKPDLVLSDFSLLQLDEKKLDNTCVITSSDAKVDTLCDELDKPIHAPDKYDRIIIIVGYNDISEAKETDKVTDIIPKYTNLLEKAKTKASQVCVSSCCPRTDKPQLKEKIDSLNSHLEVMCNDNGCDFVDNSPVFTLGDGSINDGYLAAGKGPHLSKSGTNKLASTLKLKVKSGHEDITLRHPRQRNTPQGNANSRSSSQRPSQNGRRSQHNSTRIHQNTSSRSRNNGDILFHRDACYYCNEQGHSTETCGHKGPVTCHRCGEKGHKSKHHRHSINDDNSWDVQRAADYDY